MDYVCVGGAQPVVPTHNDPVSPTYKDVESDRTLTTSSCLRLIGVDSNDRDQVMIKLSIVYNAAVRWLLSLQRRLVNGYEV